MEDEKKQQQQIESGLLISPEKIPSSKNSSSSSSATPLVPLKVPNAFNYPERYKSPTDRMVSPVTKGILARKRRAASASASAGAGGEAPPLPPINSAALFQPLD